MKKCPTCQKTFDDNLKFCQSDGTPLVEDAPPPDPYATMVASKDELMSAIPDAPKDTPSASVAEADDLLDIPDDSDSNKTMFVSDAERRDMFDESSSQPIPPPSFGQDDFQEEPSSGNMDTLLAQPEPPKFNEPDLNPPSFGEVSSASDSTPAPPASPFGNEPPTFDKHPLPSDFDAPPKSDDSPFNAPIPSPFGEQMPPSYNAPSTPPFAPPEFIVEEIKAEQLNTPFAEEVSQGNQQMAESSWTPPAVPEQSWENQETGQTPPPAGAAGENKTLAMISLVLGILSIPCCGFIIFGIGAVVTGFMAKGKVDSNPKEYGGRTFALAGIIMGAITILIGIIGNLLVLLGVIPIPNF
ncbi:hypothetical protein BH20ACI4_BH20ACI4_31620 [soil metagenome]